MGELFIIRYAQASFGQADYDRLSELGFRQARLLEAFFNRIGSRFQSIYSGSLKRQVDTAETLRSCFRADVPQMEEERRQKRDERKTTSMGIGVKNGF